VQLLREWPVRESTTCEKEQDARDFLRRREGAAASGAPILPRADRVTYDDVAADLRAFYAATGTRNLVEVDYTPLDRPNRCCELS
jgi:hypothetical protein